MKKLAIIGAGASGSFLAHLLNHTGQYKVSIFEKSRGVGGRCAVRRLDNKVSFNTGAQFFTNKNKELSPYFSDLLQHGLISEFQENLAYFHSGVWEKARKESRFLGKPAMNSFIKYWAQNAAVNCNSKIQEIYYDGHRWKLEDEKNDIYQAFDTLVLSVPYPQGCAFWSQESSIDLPSVEMFPCWALMLITESIPLNWQAAFVRDSNIAWYRTEKIDNDKTSWVVHGSEKWSQKNLEVNKGLIKKSLIKELQELLELDLKIYHSDCHRWRYASSLKPDKEKISLGFRKKSCLYR